VVFWSIKTRKLYIFQFWNQNNQRWRTWTRLFFSEEELKFYIKNNYGWIGPKDISDRKIGPQKKNESKTDASDKDENNSKKNQRDSSRTKKNKPSISVVTRKNQQPIIKRKIKKI